MTAAIPLERRNRIADLARRKLAEHGILFSSVTGKEYDLRGDNQVLVADHTYHETVISGPRDTGKTVAACLKSHSLALQYPGCQGAIVRKTYESMPGSVLQTFARIAAGSGVTIYGGQKPQWFDYPNKSRIWVGGLDNPDKVLSSERDFIQVCQTEELTEPDWEFMLGTASGRAGNIPHAQIFGDCNPGGSKHWIRKRAAQGKLRLLKATHKDNPTIFNADGSLTAGGKARLAVLEKLTGVRRKRLFEGIWATAEGAVYDMFDATEHCKVRDRHGFRMFALALDEGYTNPACILVIGIDGDGRWHIFEEYYQTGQVEAKVVREAKLLWNKYNAQIAAVDEAAASLVAAINIAGMCATGGKGGVDNGIAEIQNRLTFKDEKGNPVGDGKPRLTVDPSCVETINEFESYIYKEGTDVPLDKDNHAMGALRYLQDVLKDGIANWSVVKAKTDRHDTRPPKFASNLTRRGTLGI